MPDPGSERNLNNILVKIEPAVVATDIETLSESFVKKAHKQSTKVFVDERHGTETEWNRILNWKTDGIQTDNPERLINYLNRK